MRTSLLALSGITLAASLAVATPALADIPNDYSTTFDASDLSSNGGTPTEITFNGISDGSVLSGLSGDLVLTLSGITTTATTTTFAFDFDFTNTSDPAIWDTARITGFGFDVDPNFSSATLTSTTFLYMGSGNYPDNGLSDHSVELCFTNNPGGGPNPPNCAGSNGGIAIGDTGDGSFTLTFNDPLLTQITLSGFIDRYQGLASDTYPNITSATGIPGVGGVPEPATWAMMLVGVGMIGSSMRRRRQKQARPVVLA